MQEITKLFSEWSPLISALVAAGAAWATVNVRIRALERKFDNGISADIKKIADSVADHSVALGKIEERCNGHKAWTQSIDEQMRELARH